MANDIVHVTKRTAALASPNFVIEQGGRYYVAVAVHEYNSADATTTEQKQGVDQVRRMFEAAYKQSPLNAAPIEPLQAMAGMNTGPRGPRGPEPDE